MHVKPTTAHSDSIDRPANKPKPGAADKASSGDFRDMLESAKTEAGEASAASSASVTSAPRPAD